MKRQDLYTLIFLLIQMNVLQYLDRILLKR